MKNIFKLKRHQNRSNEVPPTASATGGAAPSMGSSTGVSSSCAPESRAAGAASSSSATTVLPGSNLPAESTRSAAAGDDYFTSEEEFQVQLALAISASNSFSDDPYADQILAAKLLSLDRDRIDLDREEGTAESLSRRYWDYNVVDYDERLADGFYDIFGLSARSQENMPSLVELQTRIGDLGFEVIVVNRPSDPALIELEQVAQCCSIDCPKSDVKRLVQMVAELVTEHMGGPVRDANDMLTKWIEKSTELRTQQQTSLLPIGCIKVGLSRHRALLFKILADHVGIPCRLVKGSHYTGVDDDAVNVIKLNHEREYLVDLMAAPGTLIPADVLSIKDTPPSSQDLKASENLVPWTAQTRDEIFQEETLYGHQMGKNGASCWECTEIVEETRFEKPTTFPSFSDSNAASSTIVGSSYSGTTSLLVQDKFPYPAVANSAKQKAVSETDGASASMSNENPKTVLDSRNLFAELNPFQVNGVGKAFPQTRTAEVRNTENPKKREKNTSGAARSQNPLVLKGWSPVNGSPNLNQNNNMDGLFPRKNSAESSTSSQMCSSDGKAYFKSSNNIGGSILNPQCTGSSTSDNKTIITTASSGSHSSEGNHLSIGLEDKLPSALKNSFLDSQADRQLVSAQAFVQTPYGGNNAYRSALQNMIPNKNEVRSSNVDGKHENKKNSYDKTLGSLVDSKNQDPSASSLQVRSNAIDPMLDDVGEWEIPWEDLVIGERIGLGSYGEVYRADWNGTEVAVKKFLDQDFYGDALDEFRSEVRIMRRLRHPNVVLFMGAVTRPPNLSIVSEFLPRGSLYRLLHRPDCQIDERRRIKMALDVAKGMNCLHTSMPTIVHRDLKSPNLLVDNDWTVKVCDFGLSRLKHSTFLSSKSTAGTPEWMAPEVLRNEPSNEKCDVYSYGVILWELATLRMPWSGMNPMQVVGAVGFQDRRLEIPKEVDPLVARIIWECWQTDPSLRPSFAQLTTTLKSLQCLVIPNHQEAQSLPMPQEISVNSTP